MALQASLLSEIAQQKEISQGVMRALLPIMQVYFYPGKSASEIICGDLGSFARGTNCDRSPDLDIAYLGASADERRGIKDWTSIGTQQLTGKKEGITSLEVLVLLDPWLGEALQQIMPVLESFFSMPVGSAHFGFLRTWVDYPGWVCNLALPHPEYGRIEIDLNLTYRPDHFGIGHAQRFAQFFKRVLDERGEETASRLILDIRKLKTQAKEKARDAQGWLDRSKKLPGFVIEGLFMHQFPPHTYAALMTLVREHRWQPGCQPSEHPVGDQKDQIIAAGFNFSALLENLACDNSALSLGAWENLLEIARTAKECQGRGSW